MAGPRNLAQTIPPYCTYREELSLNELLSRGNSKETFQMSFTPVKGVEKTKIRARTPVFWNNLTKDIEEMTKACRVYQQLQPK